MLTMSTFLQTMLDSTGKIPIDKSTNSKVIEASAKWTDPVALRLQHYDKNHQSCMYESERLQLWSSWNNSWGVGMGVVRIIDIDTCTIFLVMLLAKDST